MTDTLVITGLSPSEEVHENENGVWNATRLERDARAGLFGRPTHVPVPAAIDAVKGVETDPVKVARYMDMSEVLGLPMIGVMEGGILWLVDGHHRLRALHALGIGIVSVYVCPEDKGPDYHVLFNGHRTLDQASAAR